jgi:hypothetical protein
MAFELQPFGDNEALLFSRLPYGDRSMGFGAIGHIRAELDWCDFYRMWCPERKDLYSPAFRSELNAMLRELRGFNGVLHGCPALGDYLMQSPRIDGRDKGFKIQTENYTYYFRCHVTGGFYYDISIYAYDNSFLLPELAGQHEIPEQCYAVDHGRLVLLRRYAEPEHVFTGDTPDANRRMADEWNASMGITTGQAIAMQMGLEHGFKDPRAWPWQYDQNGEPRSSDKPHQKDKEAR